MLKKRVFKYFLKAAINVVLSLADCHTMWSTAGNVDIWSVKMVLIPCINTAYR